ALYRCMGGGTYSYTGVVVLASEKATRRAISWGRAMRLGQRISGGTRNPLEQTRLRKADGRLEIIMAIELRDLYGDAVAKRHMQLAKMLDLEAVLVTE